MVHPANHPLGTLGGALAAGVNGGWGEVVCGPGVARSAGGSRTPTGTGRLAIDTPGSIGHPAGHPVGDGACTGCERPAPRRLSERT